MNRVVCKVAPLHYYVRDMNNLEDWMYRVIYNLDTVRWIEDRMNSRTGFINGEVKSISWDSNPVLKPLEWPL